MLALERVLVKEYRVVLWCCSLYGASDQSHEKFFEGTSEEVENGTGNKSLHRSNCADLNLNLSTVSSLQLRVGQCGGIQTNLPWIQLHLK